MNRRDAVKAVAATVGSVALMKVAPILANEKNKLVLESTDIVPKPLSFDPKKLHGLSEKLIQSHWENNYGGSVKTLNTVNKKIAAALADKDFPPFAYNGLKREHLNRTGSVVFHELYFGNLGGNGKISGNIEKIIKSSFTDMNAWETEFRRIAQGLSGASGWVILGYNYHLKRLENYWAADHMHAAIGLAPLLVMDMYEHSYQMDYGAAAMKYVDAFFQNINWEAVESRLEKIERWKWI